ncbi:MAG TPA: ATP12 family protein [Geminicoccaceae bacterium]|jgi:chaperone required for assembly of F1-ATPase|nr:ATP12 family protein [Geminicoccaceae bacterium]
MKRLYRQVEVAGEGDRHRVLLDGRPVRTPAKRVLTLPTSALAAALAAEWRDQGDTIQAATMPLTRLASTAQERLPGHRAAAITELIGYADTDLLCYRAAAPLDLVERQGETWQPLLDWAASTHGARLVVTTSILPVSQPATAVSRLQAAVEARDDWALVGLHAATTALGSLVLGLALVDGRIDAGQALAASLLDELFEIERWGQDAETKRRHAALRRDVEAAATFLASLASGRA